MEDYQEFTVAIKKKTGIDLALYKEQQMKRRLMSLRDKRGYSSFISYYNAISTNTDLMDEFLNKVTINVSEFYRNYSRWEVFEKKVLPVLINASSGKIKIWSAACSTGEEPYTLAMILSEQVDMNQVEIIATDIDDKVIQVAKAGVYPERALKEVPIQMKQKYFKKDGSLYYIDNRIKSCVTFQKHNLLADSYQHNFDLIVCRNVLIYFTEQAKTAIYQKFSNSLKENGVLFVGSTEQIFNPNRYGLTVYDTFFYQKTETN